MRRGWVLWGLAVLIPSAMSFTREAVAATPGVEQFCCGQLAAVDADGRMALYFPGPARYDRLTGQVQRTTIDGNLYAMDDEGRFVSDAFGKQHDLVTGEVVDLGGRFLDADAVADKILVLRDDGSQSLIQRSTGTITNFPPTAGAFMLSPSGRFVGMQETTPSPRPPILQSVKLLDTATGKSYLLRRSSTIVDVADDGSVILGAYTTTGTTAAQYYDMNPLTGRSFPLPGTELRYASYVEGNALSNDGSIIMAHILDQIVVIDATTRESTILGPWPTPNSVWISQPILQGDGNAVLYSTTDQPTTTSNSVTHIVTLPVRANASPHVRASEVVVVDVSGRVPADATAAVLNVTVTNPLLPGFVTGYTCGEQPPLASNVNFVAGQTIPNVVVARPSSSGTVCLLSSAPSDLVVDLQGYVPSGGSIVGVGPNRILDSRTGLGLPQAGKLPRGQPTRVQVAGTPGVPGAASAAELNVTATAGDQSGFLTVYPCADHVPTASNLNFSSSQTIANAVISSLDAEGGVCLFSNTTTHVVIDVDGYIGTTAGFVGQEPARLVDTRIALGVPSTEPIPAGGVVVVPLAGRPGITAGSSSVVLNLTATEPAAAGFVTAWPCGSQRPVASNLNYERDQTIPNLVLSGVDQDGNVCLFTQSATHLVVDLAGSFDGPTSYTPLVPTRVLDTRELLT